MKQCARRLLREIHLLATTYHWPEREILGLSHRRRLAYLLMIEADRDTALYGGGSAPAA